jgi:ligand-binding sensor domain-containing protein
VKGKHIFIFIIFLGTLFFTFSSLIALNPQKAVTQYKQDTWQGERGLVQKSVFSVCQTRDGYIWLGTSGGLFRFNGVSFTTFNKQNTKELESNKINVLLEDRSGNLWLGTPGGLSCIKNGKFISYTREKYPGLKEISTISQDRAGTLWIATKTKRFFHLKNGFLTPYSIGDAPGDKQICAFYEDNDGHFWLGTSAGLYTFDPTGSHDKFTIYTGESGPFEKDIFTICGTKNGELWLGSSDGLYRLKDNRIKHFGKDLPKPAINCIYEDSDQNLWAGTDGSGLIRVKNDSIETFPPEHKLSSKYILAIHEDGEKNLWLGLSGEGLYRLKDTLFTPYTAWEGLNHDAVGCLYTRCKSIKRRKTDSEMDRPKGILK